MKEHIQKARDNLIERLQGFKNTIDNSINRLKNTPFDNEWKFLEVKTAIGWALIDFITMSLISANACPFCINSPKECKDECPLDIDNTICCKCEYGKLHIPCSRDTKSTYSLLINTCRVLNRFLMIYAKKDEKELKYDLREVLPMVERIYDALRDKIKDLYTDKK